MVGGATGSESWRAAPRAAPGSPRKRVIHHHFPRNVIDPGNVT